MPRLVPKRSRRPDQLPGAPIELRPIVHALRVTKSFTCENQLFVAGSLVDPDSDLVQAIAREFPDYLEPARNPS